MEFILNKLLYLLKYRFKWKLFRTGFTKNITSFTMKNGQVIKKPRLAHIEENDEFYLVKETAIRSSKLVQTVIYSIPKKDVDYKEN